jgi:hypothetical protein
MVLDRFQPRTAQKDEAVKFTGTGTVGCALDQNGKMQ